MGIESDKAQSDSRESAFQLFNLSGYNLPVRKTTIRKILTLVEKHEKASFSLLEVVYVDKNEITRINKKYLDRDYVTDIISFAYEENAQKHSIEGTLYCCAPRIAEQASEFSTLQTEEFYRVFIHGVLHLIGYDDQTELEKEQMRALENHYLSRANLSTEEEK